MAKKEEKQVLDLGLTLYDMNKQAMAQEPPLDQILFNIKMKEIADVMAKKEYWMLLNNERKDYTVFKVNNSANIIDEVSITLTNRGQIISIDKQEDGNYEIWIRDYDTKENFVYYLFDYTFGIVMI